MTLATFSRSGGSDNSEADGAAKQANVTRGQAFWQKCELVRSRIQDQALVTGQALALHARVAAKAARGKPTRALQRHVLFQPHQLRPYYTRVVCPSWCTIMSEPPQGSSNKRTGR